jgi:hypothetical protein
MTDVEKVKALSLWVTDHMTYSMASLGKYSVDHYGRYATLAQPMLGGIGDCACYEELAGFLFCVADLPTAGLQSSDHEWNMVKAGGVWYHVDTTWLDGDGTEIWWEWLLASDAFVRRQVSHSKWDIIPSTLYGSKKLSKSAAKSYWETNPSFYPSDYEFPK